MVVRQGRKQKSCVFSTTGKRRSKYSILVIVSRPASAISFGRMFPISDDIEEKCKKKEKNRRMYKNMAGSKIQIDQNR